MIARALYKRLTKKETKECDPHATEIDLCMAINKFETLNTNINRNYKWVESHQSDDNASIEVKLNNWAD